MTEPWRKPWWKRKRWIAAAALWLAAAYPLSLGPFAYAFNRDWIPNGTVPIWAAIYNPLVELMCRHPQIDAAFNRYANWWADRGHEAHVRAHPELYEHAPPLPEHDGTAPAVNLPEP